MLCGAAAALGRVGRAIKAALLDQSFSAGVGNWVADEVLYQVRSECVYDSCLSLCVAWPVVPLKARTCFLDSPEGAHPP